MKPNSMLLAVLFFLALSIARPASSQVFSVNCVGYVNHTFSAGDSLFGNPLSATNNTLSALFPGPLGALIPDGTTVAPWNPVTQGLLPVSTYSQASGWSIDYSLPPRLGALFHTPSPFLNTFIGEVVGGCDPITLPTPPPSGLYLMSSQVPFTNATFFQTIGRDPREGESVTRLDNGTGNYFTTTFHNGLWDNGDPSLNIAEAGFFNLVPVPEPATIGLVLVGMAMFLTTRRRVRARRC